MSTLLTLVKKALAAGLAVLLVGMSVVGTARGVDRASQADGAAECDWWVVSPLANVFRDTPRPADANEGIDLLAARNETECAQIVIRPRKNAPGAHVEVTPLLQAGGGQIIAPGAVSCRFVGYVHVGKNSTAAAPGELLRKAPADFPDPLLEDSSVPLTAGENQPLLVIVAIPRGAAPGKYSGSVRVSIGADTFIVPLRLEVLPITLPERIPLLVTNWFNAENIAKFHSVPVWSEDFWQVLRRYAREMHRGHQNVVYTPLDLVQVWREQDGHLKFDFGRFDRWVELFDFEGVAERIELTHLGGRTTGQWESPTFTTAQRPATDRNTGRSAPIEIEQFLPPLERHLEERGWLARTLLHVADEPTAVNVASWREQSDRAHRAAPKLKRIDAIHVPASELEGRLEMLVPQLNYFEQWLPGYQAAQRAGRELWFYIAWVPQGKYTNRLIDLACIKTRLIHWINYKYGATGYLHWGLNFWTDFKEMGLAPGDNWIIYPGTSGPRSSLRWEAMRDGIEDFALFQMLSRRDPALAQKLCGEILRSFTDYDQDPGHLEQVRRTAARALSASQ